jgi:uncharacterized protein
VNTAPAGEPPLQPPLIGDGGLAVLGLLAAVLCGGLAYSVADAAGLGLVSVTAASSIGLWLGMLGPAVLTHRRSTLERYLATMRPSDVAWVIMGPLLQGAVSLAYMPFVDRSEVEASARELADRAQGRIIPFAALCVVTVVGAPVVEELFFRGVLLRGLLGTQLLRSVRAPSIAAVVGSAALFGAIHQSLLLFPALFGFGIVCAALRLWTNRLGPPVWVHVGFNATTMALLALQIW